MRRKVLAVALAVLGLSIGADVSLALAQSTVSPHEGREMSEAESVARQYVSAYSAADWDTMGSLMSDDFVFTDRTNPESGEEEYDKETMLAMLEEYETRWRILGFFLDFPRVFASNGVVVFSGNVNALSLTDDPDYGLRWRAEQVLIVTVREGRVVRHDDYANYAAPSISRERLDGEH